MSSNWELAMLTAIRRIHNDIGDLQSRIEVMQQSIAELTSTEVELNSSEDESDTDDESEDDSDEESDDDDSDLSQHSAPARFDLELDGSLKQFWRENLSERLAELL